MADYSDSGDWAAAGIAFGIGLIEGRIERERHQEVLRTIRQANADNDYIAELESRLDLAKKLYYDLKNTSIQRGEHIKQLEASINTERKISTQQKGTIAVLKKTSDDQAQQISKLKSELAASKNHSDAQQRAIEKLTLQVQTLENLRELHLKQVDFLTGRTERLEELNRSASRRNGKLLNQVDSLTHQRDVYFQRLIDIYEGKDVPDPTSVAPELASPTPAQ